MVGFIMTEIEHGFSALRVQLCPPSESMKRPTELVSPTLPVGNEIPVISGFVDKPSNREIMAFALRRPVTGKIGKVKRTVERFEKIYGVTPSILLSFNVIDIGGIY